MSKILANEIANYGDNAPIELKEGLNIPVGKPLQAAGVSGSNGQVLTSTGTTVQWTTPFDGNYNSLTNLPTIPAAQVNADWNAVGNIAEILNKPVVPAQPSVSVVNASGSGNLSYNQSSGLFTFTPPDLSVYASNANEALWDQAYNWGDHAAAGYADGTNEANWDLAFSWGNHANSGYLTAEVDTLDTVVSRGGTTSGDVQVGKLIVDKGGNGIGKLEIVDTGSYSQLQFYSSDGNTGASIQGVEGNLYLNASNITLGFGNNVAANGQLDLNNTSPRTTTTNFYNGFVVQDGQISIGSNTMTTLGWEPGTGTVLRHMETLPLRIITTNSQLEINSEFNTYIQYNDVTKFTVTAAGVTVSGDLDVTGNVNTNLGDLADVDLSAAAQDGQVIKYEASTGLWKAANDLQGNQETGISLTDLSVNVNPVGTSNLTYNSTDGVFTYTPPNLNDRLSDSEFASAGLMTTDGAGTYSITTNNSSDWDTAFGWGDHAQAGYLTSYTETDPVFTASPAGGILLQNITNWNTAYGWGDHGAAGYVTTTDLNTELANSDNWDTAYGWGDHSAAGYLGSQATNVVIGNATTGDAITTGDQNVLIGQGAGSAVTNTTNNVFVGARAGAEDIGSYNIAIGPDAGDISYGEIANVENVALGRSAGNIRNGNGNIGIGHAALSSTATSSASFFNVALGYQAMGNARINGASYNTSIGQQAGYNLSSGDANILIGDYAAFGMTTGSNNVIIGAQAGDDITTGDNNVIINGGNYQNGTTSGFTATTSNSLWIGHSSYAWITGASSGTTRTVTIPGQLTAGGLTYPTTNGTSGQVLTSDGTGNVVWGLGQIANVTISDTAPGSAQPGDLWWESDKGRLKVYYNDTDSSQWVDASPPLADATSIGGQGTVAMLASLIPDTNAAYDFGSAEYKIRDLYLSSASDIRLKKDVVDYSGGLAFVESLRVVDFTWKDGVDNKAGKRETGLIAQEVEEALDASNYNTWRLHTDGDTQGLDKEQLIPALISAIQELSARVKELENK